MEGDVCDDPMEELMGAGGSSRPEWDESAIRPGSWEHYVKVVVQAVLTVHDKGTMAALKGKRLVVDYCHLLKSVLEAYQPGVFWSMPRRLQAIVALETLYERTVKERGETLSDSEMAPYMPPPSRLPLYEHCDVLVIGDSSLALFKEKRGKAMSTTCQSQLRLRQGGNSLVVPLVGKGLRQIHRSIIERQAELKAGRQFNCCVIFWFMYDVFADSDSRSVLDALPDNLLARIAEVCRFCKANFQ